ncbi:unnamed protein product [Paramecium octaurelia]|uniref:Calcineurin-like phosphoesterase domain-containing protein n=1 Tax=Paramecium octaurelia TaxID=43137 RepID=A0A8S1UA46_PAROT|nr:unnamed protein product [Paramecium octaurelia]
MTFFDLLWDGKGMTYDHSFAMEVAKVVVLVSMGIFVVNVILSVIVYFLLKPKKQKLVGQINITDSFFEVKKEQKPMSAIIVESINIVLFWFIIGPLALALVSYSVFNLIPSWVCGLLIFLLGMFGILVQIWRHSQFWKSKSFKKRYTSAALYFKYLLAFELTTVVFFSIFLPLAFQKGCLCVYNKAYGVDTFLDLQFSSKWTRSNWLPDEVCPKGTLCHIYATLPEETSSEVFINVHSGTDIKELDAQFRFQDSKINIKCDKIPFPSSVEERGQRNVFTCLFTGLKSYTLYDVDLIYKEKVLNSTKYRTIAEQYSDDDVVILFGGDWGYQKKGLMIVDQITKVNPDAILIGGDIAYDNGNVHCYYSFDLLLSVFESQFAKVGRLIPFIFSVGNHDVGFNDYAKYNITVSDERGPLYFTYFPQRKSTNNTVLPIKHRVTFNIQKMQNLLLFGLDSGYLYPHYGTQSNWMISILQNEAYASLNKFAHYHVPIYPTCYNNNSFMNSWDNLLQARAVWVPLFDTYEFVGAFENHVHQYKRTYPLKANKKSDKGTVYFGDGSMGIRTVNCEDESKTYLPGRPFDDIFETVITNNSDHFWVLRSYGKNQTIDFNAFQPDYTFIQNSTYVVNARERKVKIDL